MRQRAIPTRPRESDVPARHPLRAAADAGLTLAEQVERLVPVIDAAVRAEGWNPEAQATAVADKLRAHVDDPTRWAEFALEARLPAPDLDVRWAVIRFYRERAGSKVDLLIVDLVRDRGAA